MHVLVLQPDISRKCAMELKRAMLERAHSVDLDPEIEQSCIDDLARLCSENVEENPVNLYVTGIVDSIFCIGVDIWNIFRSVFCTMSRATVFLHHVLKYYSLSKYAATSVGCLFH